MTDAVDIGEETVRETPFRKRLELVQVKPGGVQIETAEQQISYAQLMAKDSMALPAHLRGNAPTCLAVLDLSLRWGFSPWQVARQTYIVNGQFSFMSQLIHAVILKFAPIEFRPRGQYGYIDDSGDFVEDKAAELQIRRCRVYTRVKGEMDDLEYITPPLGKITPKNSPLWGSDPDLQLFYMATTRLSRKHFPDILMGIYSEQEIMDGEAHVGFEHAKVVSDADKLHERLQQAAKTGEGFKEGVVDAGLEETPEGTKRRRRTAAKPAATTASEQMTEGGGEKGDDGEAKGSTQTQRSPASPKPAAAKRKREIAEPSQAPVPGPSTPAEYALHVKGWLPTLDDPNDIEKQWMDEMKIRNAVGMTAEEREPVRSLVEARIAELESA